METNGHTVDRLWLTVAIILSAIFVVISVVHPLVVDDVSRGLHRILFQFSLRKENNLAAWWSGMLLLLASAHCIDGWALFRRTNPRVAGSWLSLALILVILSCDELSSIHERLGGIEAGRWVGIVPFATVLFAMLAYTAIGFHRDKGHRAINGWMLIAFGLFAGVALLEEVEQRFQWSVVGSAVRGGMEEGIELGAMLILLKLAIQNSRRIFGNSSAGRRSIFYVAKIARPYLLVAGFVAAPILAYVTSQLTDHFRGRPADWFAASVFLVAALTVVRNYASGTKRAHLWAAVVMCAASATIVIPPWGTLNILGADISRRALVYTVLLIPTMAIFRLVDSREKRSIFSMFTVSILILAVYLGASENLFLTYLMPQYLALAIYAGVSSTDSVSNTQA